MPYFRNERRSQWGRGSRSDLTSPFNNSVNVLLGKSQEVAAVSDIEVLSSTSSTELIEILDNTIENLTSHRSDLSTISSRLDFTASANLRQTESLSAAKSSIEDTDFAVETAELVRNQILQQAQVAVSAQANTQLQIVLGLFSF